MFQIVAWIKKNPAWTFIVILLVVVPFLIVLSYAERNHDGLSLTVAVSAWSLAIFSLIYTIKTWDVSKRTLVSQKQTERNTQKVNFYKQCELLLNLRLEILQKLAYIAALTYYINGCGTKCSPKKHKLYNIKLSETYIYEDSALDRENPLKNKGVSAEFGPMQRIVMDDYICLCSIKEKIANFNNIVAICLSGNTDDFGHDYELEDLLEDLKDRLTDIAQEIMNVNCVYDDGIIMSLDNSICCFTRSDLMAQVPKGDYCKEYAPIIYHLFVIGSRHEVKSDYFRFFQYRVFEASNNIRDWFYGENLSL